MLKITLIRDCNRRGTNSCHTTKFTKLEVINFISQCYRHILQLDSDDLNLAIVVQETI